MNGTPAPDSTTTEKPTCELQSRIHLPQFRGDLVIIHEVLASEAERFAEWEARTLQVNADPKIVGLKINHIGSSCNDALVTVINYAGQDMKATCQNCGMEIAITGSTPKTVGELDEFLRTKATYKPVKKLG